MSKIFSISKIAATVINNKQSLFLKRFFCTILRIFTFFASSFEAAAKSHYTFWSRLKFGEHIFSLGKIKGFLKMFPYL